MKTQIKKIIIITVLLTSFLCIHAYADTPDSILFRNQSWYDTLSNVYASLLTDPDISFTQNSIKENFKIGDWCTASLGQYSNVSVENGGVGLIGKTTVAGYPADCRMEFIYPIVSGFIEKNTDQAELFKGYYTIRDGELSEIYKDLKAKLTSLYGESVKPERTTDWFDTRNIRTESFWKGKDGSILWLVLYFDSFKKTDDAIKLSYGAPDCTKRILELEKQIEHEIKMDLENNTVPKNNNTNGL